MSASLFRLAVPLFIASGLIFAAAILDELEAQRGVCLCGSLFTLHPFATEYFYYGEVAFATSVLAVFFASIAVWSAFRAPPTLTWRCIAIGAVVLALGDYQNPRSTISRPAALLVLAARLSRRDSAQGVAGLWRATAPALR